MSHNPSLPTLFCLHALGMSKTEFAQVAERLEGDFDVIALDLPGFGSNSADTGVSVEEMVDFVTAEIRTHGSARWMLVGHSMGGKIATIIAARTLSGRCPVFGLAGVILLAASPPCPEPMSEHKRGQMIGWTLGGALSTASAREFLDANIGGPLDAADDDMVMADLQRTSPEAWRAWFQRGSREDWSEEVGELRMPALIISGGADGDLGETAQHELNGPVYPDARFEALEGAGHLLPLERPSEVAELIRDFWLHTAGDGPAIPADVAKLIASPRTSARTRGILARRALSDDWSAAPKVLDAVQLHTLRAVAGRVIPQDQDGIDLAGRLDAQLARGVGDGWRNSVLPVDLDAYRRALDMLDGFATLSPEDRDGRLRAIADGSADFPGQPTPAPLTPGQLTAWFEDARADLVRLWLAHPASLARVGFDGFANGGDGERKQGFELIAAGEREAWQPATPTTRGRHA